MILELKAELFACATSGKMLIFSRLLRTFILQKLGLPEAVQEENLYELCLMSIKLRIHGREGVADTDLEARLRKFDCHQTDAAVQKKVLLLMHLERMLEVPPSAGGSIPDVKALSDYLYRCLTKGEKG